MNEVNENGEEEEAEKEMNNRTRVDGDCQAWNYGNGTRVCAN